MRAVDSGLIRVGCVCACRRAVGDEAFVYVCLCVCTQVRALLDDAHDDMSIK